MYKGLIHHYRSFLPVTDTTPIVSLHEGQTPLIPINNLAKHLGIPADWYVKFEGLNPTGSFKDRGMTMAITKAKEEGARMVMCASTGNTSASAAAYAAKAGMSSCVIIPEGKISLGKLAQAMMHGALVLQIEGNFDNALDLVREITAEYPITLVNSVNPYRIEGQKTGAFEIVDALGKAPDFHFIPVGNAGNITAYWKGYKEYNALGKSTLPKMMGYQAAGAAPIVMGHPIEKPETIATAIRIGNPASWKQAEEARDASGGLIDLVTDEEITEAQQLLAAHDGVFCEPASAASVAGVIKYAKQHRDAFEKGQTIVSILTGHGLKDPNRAIEISSRPIQVAGKKTAIAEILKPLLG
ncbi:MAG: threonine synthase [Candidatus Margulisiibacteriota bacterium]